MRGMLLIGSAVLLSLAATAPSLANKIITSPPPEIVEVCVGKDTTICVYATPLVTGDQLRYQWYKNGQQLSGENGPCLTIRNPQLVDDWSVYEVEVVSYYISGGREVVTGSERAATTLRVYEPAVIVSQPQNWSGCEGRSLTLSVVAQGSGLSFQWYKDGQPVSGATASTYTAIASEQHNGTWWCVITGPCGTMTTDQVQVEVRQAPRIAQQPNSVAACVGTQVTLSVSATGDAPLTYQWYRNGTPVGTGQAYTFTLDRNTEGTYWVVVSNACGQVRSRDVIVSAKYQPQITGQPQGGTWSVGARIVLRVDATGTLPLNYQWQKDGVDIPGATSQAYVIYPAQPRDAGRYRCRVSNECGEVWSNEVTVIIDTTTSVSETAELNGYVLHPILPAPVTGTATVRFATPYAVAARLVLYDAYGRKVATLAEGFVGGQQELTVDLNRMNLAAGVYVVRLEAAGIVLSQPFVVLR